MKPVIIEGYLMKCSTGRSTFTMTRNWHLVKVQLKGSTLFYQTAGRDTGIVTTEFRKLRMDDMTNIKIYAKNTPLMEIELWERTKGRYLKEVTPDIRRMKWMAAWAEEHGYGADKPGLPRITKDTTDDKQKSETGPYWYKSIMEHRHRKFDEGASLTLQIISAKGLPRMQGVRIFDAGVDPICEVCILDADNHEVKDSERHTSHKWKTSSPVWNQAFNIGPVKKNMSLRIEVWHKSPIVNAYIGAVLVSLADIEKSSDGKFEMKLTDVAHKSATLKTKKGTISFEAKYIDKDSHNHYSDN